METKPDEWQEPQENPETFENIKAMLDKANIKYDLSEHKAVLTSQEAADVRGVSLESGAKAMLFRDSKNKTVPLVMAIVSASCRVNSKVFKKLINAKSLSGATK